MQSDKTIQFWDDYHGGNDSEEWISKPGEELLEMIFDQVFSSNTDDKKNRSRKECFSVLEIGCGTSTLVRDFKYYIEERKPMTDVIACGTDVSKVCIDVNNKRDCKDDSKSDVDKECDSRGSLWYEVLNALEGKPSSQSWDLIIDKGCLDTFLFRSRKRGAQNKTYPESLRVLLDNIHGWQGRVSIAGSDTDDDDKQCEAQFAQKDDNDLSDEEKRTKQRGQLPTERPTGVYICITPRPKLKAVRDYAGFSSVRRFILPQKERSTLESKNRIGKKNANEDSGEGESGFMYVCTRNTDYQVGVSAPFPSASSSRHENNNLPNDENTCPGCDRTFLEFIKGGMETRGEAYCLRKWKMHIVHCKRVPIHTN